uniref:Type III potassium channel toxin protein n=1 Tax=Anemonia sulcata TaxID=6108 RepID=A0A0S1M199_ANESU|nr:type III potassium channel toxin protein [Anemonia sulcata]
MNKVLFLFLVVLVCATIVFASEQPAEERKFRKLNASQCGCGVYSRKLGDYWFWRADGTCPKGYGYTSSCELVSGMCCFPRYGK